MSTSTTVRLKADNKLFARHFDQLPFPFEHNLSSLDLLSFESLYDLAGRYTRDFFVAGTAAAPETVFYSVPHDHYTPAVAMERLESLRQRVLLKRPELYDDRFKELLHTLFRQIVEMRGGLSGERVVRLTSGIFISASHSITPFHFDPEVTFFFQIEGEKVYHLYTPAVLSEPELEAFYKGGHVDIGQVDFDGRDPHEEHVFELLPGMGMHQPQNSPHWVETSRSRSISYTLSFETDAMRRRSRARAFNYYLRRAGITPSPLDANGAIDRAKAQTMTLAIPFRRAVARAAGIHRARG
jgi:hypothetical protein